MKPEWIHVSGTPYHAHSLEEMNAGQFLPGEECDACREKSHVMVDGGYVVTDVDLEKRTVTVSRMPATVARAIKRGRRGIG